MNEKEFRFWIVVAAMIFAIGSCSSENRLKIEIKQSGKEEPIEFTMPERGQALPFTKPFDEVER